MYEEQQKAQLGKFITVVAFLVVNIVCYVGLDFLSRSEGNQEIFFYIMCVPSIINAAVIFSRFGDFLQWAGLLAPRKARFDRDDLKELKALKRKHRRQKRMTMGPSSTTAPGSRTEALMPPVDGNNDGQVITVDDGQNNSSPTPVGEQQQQPQVEVITVEEEPKNEGPAPKLSKKEQRKKQKEEKARKKKEKKSMKEHINIPLTALANPLRVNLKVSEKKAASIAKEKRHHKLEHISRPKKYVAALLPIYKETVEDLMRTIISLEENVRHDPYLKMSMVLIVDGKDDVMQQKAVSFLRLHFRLKRIETFEKKEDKVKVDVHRRSDYAVPCICERGSNSIDVVLLVKHKNGGKYDSQKLFLRFIESERYFNAFKKTKALLMVDSDTLLEPDAVSILYDELIGSPDHVAGVCGEVIEETGNQFLSNWFQGLLNAQYAEFKVSHWMGKRLESLFGGVTCLPGCFCMFRMAAINDPRVGPAFVDQKPVSLFKRLMVQLGEDRYLTLLLHHAGYTAKMAHRAVAYTRLVPNLQRFLIVRKRWTNSTLANNLALTFSFKAWFPANPLAADSKAHLHVAETSHDAAPESTADDSTAVDPRLRGVLATNSKTKNRKKERKNEKPKDLDPKKEAKYRKNHEISRKYLKQDRWTRFVDWLSYVVRYPWKWPVLFIVLAQTAVFFITPAVFFKIMSGLANSLNQATIKLPGEVVLVIIIVWALLNVILTMTVNAATNQKAVAVYRALTIINCFMTLLSLIGLPVILVSEGLETRHQKLLLIASLLYVFVTILFLVIHFEFRALCYLPFLLVLTPLYTIIVTMYSIFHLDDFTWGRENLGKGEEAELNMPLPTIRDKGLIACSLIMANTRVVASRITGNTFRDYMPTEVLNYVRNRWVFIDETDNNREVRIEIDGGGGQNNSAETEPQDAELELIIASPTPGNGENAGQDNLVEVATATNAVAAGEMVKPHKDRIPVQQQDWFRFLMEQNKYESVSFEYYDKEPQSKDALESANAEKKKKQAESYIKRCLNAEEKTDKHLFGVVMLSPDLTQSVYTIVKALLPSSLKDWKSPRGEWYMADQYSADVFPLEALEKIQPPYILCFEQPPTKKVKS